MSARRCLLSPDHGCAAGSADENFVKYLNTDGAKHHLLAETGTSFSEWSQDLGDAQGRVITLPMVQRKLKVEGAPKINAK